MRGTLRLVAGTASLAAGGWLVRALHGAPDALGAHPASIAAVAAGSPHYRDGVFVNLEPASDTKMDREQLRLIAWELMGNRGGSRPRGPIPLTAPEHLRCRSQPARRQLVRPLDGAAGNRRLPGAHRSGVERPMFTVGHRRAAAAASAAGATRRAARRRRGGDQPRPLRPPRHRHDHGVGPHSAVAVRRPARRRRPPARSGASPSTASSSSIGTRAHRSTSSPSFVYRRGTSRDAFSRRNNTLWASWVFRGPTHRAYFGGDTGYTKSFAQIGADHGPFDLTLLPIGAYNTAWPDVHMNPEEAVRAHLDVTDGWTAGAGPLGHFPVGAAPVGRTGRAAARRSGARAGERGGARARSAH